MLFVISMISMNSYISIAFNNDANIQMDTNNTNCLTADVEF